MKIGKILFIAILCFQSKAQAEVAPNLEPFFLSTVGVLIANGEYYWKEFQNSSKAIYAYKGCDYKSSLYYPKMFDHKVHGKVAFFECGGGYPNTAIQVYGRGYLYCGNFNGTPTEDQLFHTFDETDGRISMQAVTFRDKFLAMWYNYPSVGAFTACKNDDCRFALEYPTMRPPVIKVLDLTADTMRTISNKKRIEVLDRAKVVSDGVEGHNSTKIFSIIKEFKHTTNWSYKFATKDWNFEFEPQNYKFERHIELDPDDKLWFDAPFSAVIGFDATKKGRSYNTTSKMNLRNHVIVKVQPGYFDELTCQIKVYDETIIPFTAKIHQTEHDPFTLKPIYSNLTVHGTWTGQVMKWLSIVCKSKPITPGQFITNFFNTYNEIQKPNFQIVKKCRILLDGKSASVWDEVHPNDISDDLRGRNGYSMS